MKLKEYQKIIEDKYGNVILPTSDNEIDEIKEAVVEGMTQVSMNDYRVLQAFMIIENWRTENVYFRGETGTVGKQCDL